MKNIIVIEEACIGCGSCIAIDDTHFDFNDDGLATVILNDKFDDENLINAIECCPTNAIQLENGTCSCTGCDCENCDC